MLASLAFYLFATVMVASALAVISARNPVHSVLFLILAFFNAAGLFVLLGAEFLAMILVIVYVGAVAVLFLFVVMMLDIDRAEFRQRAKRYLPLGALVGVVLFAQLAFVVSLPVDSIGGGGGAQPVPVTPQAAIDGTITNTAALGQVLYTRYAFLFQMAGMTLLVAMIGAITLTLRPRNANGRGARTQVVDSQIERGRTASVTMESPERGRGVAL